MDKPQHDTPVLLQTGFRIFFLGAAGYTVIAMLAWLAIYAMGVPVNLAMPPAVWHGHEMIFGFTMAVVAGFLLTAVINWTGLPTLSGRPLLVLFLLWLSGRMLAFVPWHFPLWPMTLCDTAFLLFLSVAVIRPITAVKQWKQSSVYSKLILVLLAGIVFYLALSKFYTDVEQKTLLFAVYIIISLIMTIGRRVMPFFIERGVGYPVTLTNNAVLDRASLILLTAFTIIDVFLKWPIVVSVISGLLVIVHILRLSGWYTPGIWKKPLLWVLFVGYIFIICGFFLKIFEPWNSQCGDSALHAFAAGGIGIFTLGMMARVSWGHTGRNIAEPPRILPLMFGFIISSAFIRVFMPLLDGSLYVVWIGLSQALWVSAFTLFVVTYYKVLTSPRPDGKRG
ncbi:MAG: NnrS family protein [Candidatus Omnitrophica bacterium]|nr:NnrS family protein [Candidatus Omnitrophota bacterium]MDE2009870.1 NnrS family protein [Candidatus Omnitrophota bacterium]MDE2214348.1 NnrS family protein [Candidatus Omnitrophota bacterium]MDE2231097.1 NnrS family protein [Candidatus Omnitrophota bacterium]